MDYPELCHLCRETVEGVPMCTSYEFVHELDENKGQFARIRDENGKFHSILLDCPNSIPYSTF